MEEAIRQARLHAPEERLELMEASHKDIPGLLKRGKINAALTIAEGEEHTTQILFRESYGVAMARAHPLAGRDAVRAEELAGETMIVRRHCKALAETSRHFTQRGVRPFFAARTISDESALSYVRSGLGITVMPMCFAREGIAMSHLNGFERERAIGLLTDPHSRSRIRNLASLEIIAQTYRKLAASSVASAA